ncbi:M20/M25/M40 family metallo-hydrolase, partial [Salinispira pacifica]
MNTPQVVHDRLIPLLQELIRNRCVNDGSLESGDETRSASTLQSYLSEYGLQAELLGPYPSRQSLLLRIPGTDPMAPSLMLMGHTDVVPANADDWTVDPFGGDVKDGHVWGRGALDMLNMTAAMAVAVAEQAAEGVSLPGDLLYLAVADEESSGRLGARWLV